MAGRGYPGHEELPWFNLINMNGRLYDPLVARFLSPDNYVQAPDFTQNFNRYTYCYNNPLIYTDPTGEIVWFVPVIIGAVVGAYTGASVQSGTLAFWDWKPDAWKGAIVGGLLGATAGLYVSAAIGATGMTVGNAGLVATKAWGVTSTALQSASLNMGFSAISGQGIDGLWKAGLVGAASGAFTATGGFGLVKQGFFGRLGYQAIGTSARSIGNNWAAGKPLLSKVTVGVGPVNLTLGKGQKLLQWQNNIGNIAFNAIGLSNVAFGGGKMSFDWKHLAPSYYGGVMEKFSQGAMGAHVIMGSESDVKGFHTHELHHIWQSRSLGDAFLPNYILQGTTAILSSRDRDFVDWMFETNYFETQAYGQFWWP